MAAKSGEKGKALHLSSPGVVSNPSTQAGIDKCVAHFKSSMPTGQGTLLSLIREDKVSVFDPYSRAAHGTTDTQKWFRQKKNSLRSIECIASARWEPYVVVRLCDTLPGYQEGFTGYGKNKVSHIIHLTATGYKFSVVGGW